jgi:pimeloyl-ACP methyl ester carboxylesterase
VRRATGQQKVAVVGHSQGGLIGMAGCARYPDRVAALVAMGSPAWFESQNLQWLLRRFLFVYLGQLNRFVARCVAPFAGVWHPPVSEVAINARNVTRPVIRRVLANVVENVSPGVLLQFARWTRTDAFDSEDGHDDYRALLSRCRQPALFVAAADDRLAPPRVVERAARAWGGPAELVTIGLAGRACCDYGHTDQLLGRRAPEDVFPRVLDWLAARDAELAQDAELGPEHGAARAHR